MIPLRDENPSRSFPVVNLLFIAANCIVFIYPLLLDTGYAETIYRQFGFVPYAFFHSEWAGSNHPVSPPMTLLTGMFLHGGWIHLLGNMLYLWIFGDNVEDILGHGRYLLFYLLCGVTATLVHGFLHMNSEIPTVGASGAIAGVLGAYLYLFPRARVKTLFIFVIIVRVFRVPAILFLGTWMLLQTYSGFSTYGGGAETGIAWFAHIGGFVSGIALIVTMRKRIR